MKRNIIPATIILIGAFIGAMMIVDDSSAQSYKPTGYAAKTSSFPPSKCFDGEVIKYQATTHAFFCAPGAALAPDGGLVTTDGGGIAVDPNPVFQTPNILTGLKYQGALVIGPSTPTPAASEVVVGGTRAPQGSALYGDGSDGPCNWDGVTTVLGVAPSAGLYTNTRAVFCSTIVISSGVTVFTPGGLPIRASVSAEIDGTGQANGDGHSAIANAAGAATDDGYFVATAGTAGGAGQATTGSSGATAGGICRGVGAAGAGGTGVSGTGGLGGAQVPFTANSGDCHDWQSFYRGRDITNTPINISSGGGGGGGTNVGGGEGGGGGGGGGALEFFAREIHGSGTFMFSARGGAGGSPSTGAGCTTGGNGCGSGGGGSGGYLLIVYGQFNGSACTMTSGSCWSNAGGLPGTPSGTGTSGTQGGAGVAIVEQAN